MGRVRAKIVNKNPKACPSVKGGNPFNKNEALKLELDKIQSSNAGNKERSANKPIRKVTRKASNRLL